MLRSCTLAVASLAAALAACGSPAPSAGGSPAPSASAPVGSVLQTVPPTAARPTVAPTTPTSGAPAPAPGGCVDPVKTLLPVSLTWLPADLPLPSGSYAARDETQAGAATHIGIFAVPVDTAALVQAVSTTWPARGWRFTRFEHDAHDAEIAFAKPGSAGSFHVTDGACGTDAQMTLALGPSA